MVALQLEAVLEGNTRPRAMKKKASRMHASHSLQLMLPCHVCLKISDHKSMFGPVAHQQTQKIYNYMGISEGLNVVVESHIQSWIKTNMSPMVTVFSYDSGLKVVAQTISRNDAALSKR